MKLEDLTLIVFLGQEITAIINGEYDTIERISFNYSDIDEELGNIISEFNINSVLIAGAPEEYARRIGEKIQKKFENLEVDYEFIRG